MSDEAAQEFQVISNGNADIEGPQVNFQNEISDPDECAKAVNVTAMREAEKTDFSLKTKDEKRSRVANPTPPDPGSSLLADPLVTLPNRSCMGDPTYELDRPQHYVFDRGSIWDVVIEVLRSSNSTKPPTNPTAGNCSRDYKSKPKQKGHGDVDHLSHVDCVPTNATSSQVESQLYIFEDNEAVIKMIIKGRSPTMRHVSRTQRVALDWLFDRINVETKSKQICSHQKPTR